MAWWCTTFHIFIISPVWYLIVAVLLSCCLESHLLRIYATAKTLNDKNKCALKAKDTWNLKATRWNGRITSATRWLVRCLIRIELLTSKFFFRNGTDDGEPERGHIFWDMCYFPANEFMRTFYAGLSQNTIIIHYPVLQFSTRSKNSAFTDFWLNDDIIHQILDENTNYFRFLIWPVPFSG